MIKLTKELAEALLKLEADHSRTSCDDERVTNGYRSSSANWPRCNRCLLLDVINDKIPEEKSAFLMDISLTYER